MSQEQETSSETPAEAQEGWKPPRSRPRVILFGSLILIGVLAILYAWGLPPFRAASQPPDNAYVRGQTPIIAPQVGGTVPETGSASGREWGGQCVLLLVESV